MTTIVALLASMSLAWVVYVYLGYPVLVALLSRIRPRDLVRGSGEPRRVSILVPAYNEAAHIEATIRNKLEQDFPAELVEILVVSDESDDGTDEIVERMGVETDGRVRLHRQVPRQGKTAGINTLVTLSAGELLLFSDANSIWAPNAIRSLARCFDDPSVGYVTGKMVYTNPDGSLVGDGCSAYMRYENFLRACETRLGSVVGVDGGIDAMRRSLYVPLRADQLPDFVQPLKVVEQGARVVYTPDALLMEAALADEQDEMSMRVRVTLRALWALKDMSTLLDPRRGALFAFQLFSHKLLRYLAWMPVVFLLPASVSLSGSTFWALVAVAQILAYGLVAGTRVAPNLEAYAPIRLARYFVLLNVACARATLAFARGERKVVWNPRKG